MCRALRMRVVIISGSHSLMIIPVHSVHTKTHRARTETKQKNCLYTTPRNGVRAPTAKVAMRKHRASGVVAFNLRILLHISYRSYSAHDLTLRCFLHEQTENYCFYVIIQCII